MSAPWKPTGKIVRIRPVRGKRLRSLEEFEPPVRTSWFSASGVRPTLPSYLRVADRGQKHGHWVVGFVAAALLGLGAGALLDWSDSPEAADAADVPVVAQRIESVAPPAIVTPEEREWAARGRERRDGASTGTARTAGGGGVRVSFSYCKWGGGTNCVVDGDTFWIGGQKVRIADIDAPETHDYRCRSELERGEAAARKLQALLNSGAVTMTRIDRNRDAYGRLLRNVSVGGRDVGETLVSEGLARWYRGHRRPWC